MINNNDSTSYFILSDILDFDKSFTDFSEIKTGGFNRLLKAKRFGKWYLLKGLKPEYASQILYKELLRKEFEISVSLNHPNIIHTIGFEQIEQIGYCIVFEFLEGYTLKEFLRTKHPLSERKQITNELITALNYIHKRQVVHRDLKPENIIITTNGHHLKLIDFGLADTDSHAILKQPAGTKKYIAPEQETSSTADCRNDIYSLGKIILEINPGFIYQHIAHHCLVSIDKRYPNIEAIQKQITFLEHCSKVFFYLLLGIFGVFTTIFIVQMSSYNNNDDSAQTLNETISYGKERIDEISLPLKKYIDTLSVFNDAAYAINQKLVDKREAQLENLLDSLTETCKESDKSIIESALNTYIEQTTPHF